MQGLYIHIPFCISKCKYCDFTSFANCTKYRKNYVETILKELSFYEEEINPKTLYIGGGTPSFLTPIQIKTLFAGIYKHFNKFKEITFEANPESLTSEKLKILKHFGVTRLSIGLQSSFDRHLKSLGRAHNFAQFLKIYFLAQKFFDNINVDIIAGLPTQTLKEFNQTLKELCKLAPSHISVYGLQVEEGTPLFLSGYVVDDKLCRKMLESASLFLRKEGYHQYEISNFARRGKESKHNINYWRSGTYLGLGCAASSFLKGVRFQNTNNLKEYLDKVSCGKKPIILEEKLKGKAKLGEQILLAFRQLDGFKPTGKMLKLFKEDFKDILKQNLIIRKQGKLALSGEGKYFANIVFRHFVEPF